MQKIKAYIVVSFARLFNGHWLEPENAGDVVAECAVEACANIYPDTSETNGTMRGIRKDWLARFRDGFNRAIGKVIE